MYESRNLGELHPVVESRATQFIAEAEMEVEGLKIIVSCTYRDKEKQHALYQVGRRNIPGERIVTNADAGESYHNFRCAFDIFPLLHGKPILFLEDGDEITDPLWQKLGEIAERNGLEWAGRWKGKLKEGPHFQYTGGLSLNELRRGDIPA